MSTSNLFLANAVATLPFGVVGYIAPAFTFAQFGLSIEDGTPEAALIRGYAATALGYGCMMAGLRDSQGQAQLIMVIASMLFNMAEFLLQGHAILENTGFKDMVWVTMLLHGVLAAWSVWQFLKYKKPAEKKKE